MHGPLAASPISFLLAKEVPRAERPDCVISAGPDFGRFLANGFFSGRPGAGKSENRRINTGILWWAWVDLNHRPRPYQERDLRDH
jgi:hypothetical protein